MNKKGQFTDWILIVIIIFFICVSLLAVGFVITKFQLVVQTTALNQSQAAPAIIAGLSSLGSNGINQAFMILLSFSIIGLLISSFFVKYHTIWIFLAVIFAGVAVLLSAILANTYDSFVNANTDIANYASQFTAMNWVMQHLVGVVIGIVIISMILFFSRLDMGGQSNI